MAKARKNMDSLCVNEDEATELLAYHLAMAHLMFQNVPDNGETRKEVLRLVANYAGYSDLVTDASASYYDSLFAAYEEMKKDG